MKSFLVVNLGCKVNAYESDAIANMLEDKGYILDQSNPDMIVVNTCSVTATSDSKSRQKIRHLIKEHPNAIVCVMGCYSQMNAIEASEIDGVGVVIGTKYRDKILDYALEYKKTGKKVIKIESNEIETKFENLVVYNFYQNTRAYLKIQDGCNNFCSYCIIPYTRGRVRSKPSELVLKEAQTLVNKGYFELVLTGIHTGGYGIEFDNYNFYNLLVDILNNVKGLKRLRISSIEINELTDEIIELIKNNNIVVNHLHIPIQSGCTDTLKRMNRKYDLDKFEERIRYIKSNIRDISITTDVIVGFPNESEEEFEITYNSLKRMEFTRLHVFPFSSREGTVASKMKGQVHGNIKKERVNRLILLSKELGMKYYQEHLNSNLEVLFEENKDGYYKGYTTNYIKVRVKSDENLKGCIKKVKLNKIVDVGMDYEVEGKSQMKYSNYIDHTLLKADASNQDIKNLCKEAIKYDFFSVCVNPCYIKLAKKYLKSTPVKVCSVIGFPLGANDTKVKVFEAKKAIKDGADEIDVVINISKLKDKKYKYVEKELANIVKVSKGKALVKVIIETCLLTKQEIKTACEIVYASGVDYVKTSTGFSKFGAQVEDVELMKEVCKDKIKIKASGGINDFEFMKSLVAAGATRIGTSHGVEIMEEIIKNCGENREI